MSWSSARHRRRGGKPASKRSPICKASSATPNPFGHAAGEIAVSQYRLEEIPPADQVGELAAAAEELLTKLLALYFRTMAQLAVTAEQVEAALGLPRLPDPPEPEGRK